MALNVTVELVFWQVIGRQVGYPEMQWTNTSWMRINIRRRDRNNDPGASTLESRFHLVRRHKQNVVWFEIDIGHLPCQNPSDIEIEDVSPPPFGTDEVRILAIA